MKRLLVCILILAISAPAQVGLTGGAGMTGGAGTKVEASGGGGSVAPDTSCNSGAVTTAQTQSCQMTIAAGATNVVIFANVMSIYRPVATVTVGAAGATLAGAIANSANDTIELWTLGSSIPTGTQTITVTWGGGAAVPTSMAAISFTGGTGAFGTVVTGSGTTSPATIAVGSSANKLVVDGLAQDQGNCGNTATPDASQAQQWSVCTVNNFRYAGSTKAGAASTVMTWTLSASPTWAEIGVSVQ